MKIKFIGQQASHTIGRHKFLRGEIKLTEEIGMTDEEVRYAIDSGNFKELVPKTAAPGPALRLKRGKPVSDGTAPDEEIKPPTPEWPSLGFTDKDACISFVAMHLPHLLESKEFTKNRALATLNDMAWKAYEAKYTTQDDAAISVHDADDDDGEIDTGITV